MNEKSIREKKFVLAERRIAILKKYFYNPTSRFGVNLGPDKGGSAECTDMHTLLMGHLLGSDSEKKSVILVKPKNKAPYKKIGIFRVGFYSPGKDGQTKWTLIDFDGGSKKSSPLKDPLAAAIATLRKLQDVGIAAHLERSGSGEGWHIWIFFEKPIPCGQARNLGLLFAPKDAPLEKDGYAKPEKNLGIEVFPKQSSLKEGDFGNYVWLPWWSNAPKGANQFYHEGVSDVETI